MNRLFKYIFYILLAVFTFQIPAVEGYAQGSTDTEYKKRGFDETILKQYKTNKDFIYETEKKPEVESGFSRWLKNLLERLFGFESPKVTAQVLDVLIYIFCAAIVIYVVLKILKADISWLFYKQKSVAPDELPLYEENIHETDLRKLLQDAMDKGEFKTAVRLFYLICLKEMSDREIIVWSRQKTNRDYSREIQGRALAGDFHKVTFLFEYIWYGNFTVNESLFSSMRGEFENFIQKVKVEKVS